MEEHVRKSFDPRLTPHAWADGEPVVIVSADSHACLPATEYARYLEPKYREDFDGFVEDHLANRKLTNALGYPFPPHVLDVIDERRAIESGGETGYFDPDRRLREVEADGVVAEILHPGGPLSFTPFFDPQNRRRSHELRAAGARAHNRFLVDLCSSAPGRLLGVPLIYPWPDWRAGVDDCQRAKESGFKAIFPPGQVGVDGGLPWFYDPWWDPLWASCEALELVVHIHAGFGLPQGAFAESVRQAEAHASAAAGPGREIHRFDAESDVQESPLAAIFETFVERRPLWQFMWGGVFDRFPMLKVAFVEIHGDWVPPTLAFLDSRYDRGGTTLKMKPSQYWQRNCAVGASLLRRGEVAARHEIGIDKLMFGTDYPHMEGTWPNTRDWIRATLADVPEPEARQILGYNAIDFYHLDRDLLERTARRVGPFPGDLFGKGQTVDQRMLRHFHYRGGIEKVASFDEARLAESFDEDERGALAACAMERGDSRARRLLDGER